MEWLETQTEALPERGGFATRKQPELKLMHICLFAALRFFCPAFAGRVRITTFPHRGGHRNEIAPTEPIWARIPHCLTVLGEQFRSVSSKARFHRRPAANVPDYELLW